MPEKQYRDRKKDSRVFTLNDRKKSISDFDYKYNNNFNITLHIRRSDVTPKRHPQRYLYNKYYINKLNKILEHLGNIDRSKIIINICSQSNSFESLDEFTIIFKDYNVKLYLDTSLKTVFDLMIHADVLVMSKSSFSFVPAFYNKRCVIYHEFWHKKIRSLVE